MALLLGKDGAESSTSDFSCHWIHWQIKVSYGGRYKVTICYGYMYCTHILESLSLSLSLSQERSRFDALAWLFFVVPSRSVEKHEAPPGWSLVWHILNETPERSALFPTRSDARFVCFVILFANVLCNLESLKTITSRCVSLQKVWMKFGIIGGGHHNKKEVFCLCATPIKVDPLCADVKYFYCVCNI